jgi:hypothetical protein
MAEICIGAADKVVYVSIIWTLKWRKKRKQMAAISSIEQFQIVRVHGSVEVPSPPQQLKVHTSVPPIAHRNKWETLLMLNSF